MANDTNADDSTEETVEHAWHMVEGDHFESFEIYLDDEGDDPDMFIFRSTPSELSELRDWIEERLPATPTADDEDTSDSRNTMEPLPDGMEDVDLGPTLD